MGHEAARFSGKQIGNQNATLFRWFTMACRRRTCRTAGPRSLARGERSRRARGLEAPRGPNTLVPGTIIAAALMIGIKSDLPSDIIATVTEDVYDSATHRNVLIPQGSRLMRRYNS